MKKILSLILAVILMVSMAGSVFSEEYLPMEFEITPQGEITFYFGESFVYIPSEVNGIPVTSIGEKAFFDLGLESVYMEPGVTTVGNSAFEGSNLNSVDFAPTVTEIGDCAFMNCENLSDIFFFDRDSIPTFGDKAFYNTPHITAYIYCTTDVEAFYEAFYKAKGDWEFSVELIHWVSEDTVEQRGDYKLPVSVCMGCGVAETRYPGPLGHPFSDVTDADWFSTYVDVAYNVGILNGKGQNTFDPNATMTCGEAAKIAASIAAMLNGQTIDKQTTGPWYAPYVDYCYENYIIEEGMMFDWEAPITRAQMAYLFCRADATNFYPNEVPITDIPDVDENTPFAIEILELYDRGVAVGDTTMSFHPFDPIKRSEAAAIVVRIIFNETRVELPKG